MNTYTWPDVDYSGLDVPLLRKAVEWAEVEAAKPEKDSEWYQPGVVTEGRRIGRSCGTAYCIGGYISYASGGPMKGEGVIQHALEALGIPGDDAITRADGVRGLFLGSNTIEDVRRIATELAELAGDRL